MYTYDQRNMKVLFAQSCSQNHLQNQPTEGNKKMPSMKNTSSSFGQRGQKKPAGSTNKSSSRVTEERAKAQRAKLDAQNEDRQAEEEWETTARQTLNKRAGRQEIK